MGTLTFILIGFMGFVVIAGLGFVFAGGDGADVKTTKRMQAIAGGANADKPRARTASEAAGVRRKQIVQTLKAAEKQERRVKLTTESRLRQAGLSISVRTFWIICGVLGLITCVATFVFMGNIFAALGVGFASGFGLPRWLLGSMIGRRTKKFTEEFPNAADVIVRGIKSGLPVNDCLKVISRESPEPLASEFRQLVESSAMGMSIDQALEKMYEHMPTSEVRFFAIVLSIQQKTGGNLAEALSNLSTVLRARKLMGEKIKAMSGEAVASAFIIGCLPPGVMGLVYVTSPGYMSQMFIDPRGHLMLLGAGIWMSMGIFVMKRMINFKF
jgi:tight adherence protein B